MLTRMRMCLQCFTLMDQNRDGIIDKEDLKDMFAQIGKAISSL